MNANSTPVSSIFQLLENNAHWVPGPSDSSRLSRGLSQVASIHMNSFVGPPENIHTPLSFPPEAPRTHSYPGVNQRAVKRNAPRAPRAQQVGCVKYPCVTTFRFFEVMLNPIDRLANVVAKQRPSVMRSGPHAAIVRKMTLNVFTMSCRRNGPSNT